MSAAHLAAAAVQEGIQARLLQSVGPHPPTPTPKPIVASAPTSSPAVRRWWCLVLGVVDVAHAADGVPHAVVPLLHGHPAQG